ncbi:MAG: YjbQ family protein [Candidatus Sericytochromatia bacterium]|nr:YjbQ family protein [Candidatus Tanganyikabacteria bacterium]
MIKLTLKTERRAQLLDITGRVADAVARSGVQDGFCVVHVPHTTAGVFVNESADPDLRKDILQFLERQIPQDWGFRHSEGNADSHLKAMITGHAATLIVAEGKPALGTWQAVWFAEYDGPRSREIWIQVSRA